MQNIIYVNGKYLPQEKAVVSVMDRGFLFGDGIYEVIPVFNGKLFGFEEHMARMKSSLDAVDIKNPHAVTEWETIFKTILKKNKEEAGNCSIYCQITRGVGETREHTYSDDLIPTVVVFLKAPQTITHEEIAHGFSAITSDDLRHRDCHIKAINLLPNILQLQKAKKAGAIEAVLIHDNEVLECTSSNIFIVKDNILMTPPLSQNILGGTTRKKIIALANENKIDCREIKISREMLENADEIWVTGCVKEICPIVVLDNKQINNGKVGPLWHKMSALYEAGKKL
ncbi:MAG: aminotransferase class IV [Coxiellaceae bacterium]|nr:aminotransferase class IV [Coxiellaceae bacterium]